MSILPCELKLTTLQVFIEDLPVNRRWTISPFVMSVDRDLFRAVLQTMEHECVVWQDVDIKADEWELVSYSPKKVCELIDVAVHNAARELLSRIESTDLSKPVDSTVQSI